MCWPRCALGMMAEGGERARESERIWLGGGIDVGRIDLTSWAHVAPSSGGLAGTQGGCFGARVAGTMLPGFRR